MRKWLLTVLLIPAGLVFAQELKPVALPAPQTAGGKPLMQVLKLRRSTREFSPEKIPPQVLSNLLWAAWGINREDGRRTAPSASNRQELDVYAITVEGAFLYDAKGNALKPVASGDFRKLAGKQAYVANAPLNLVYVADFAKLPSADETGKIATSHANTGFIAQNVYLFCASEGLVAVVRGIIDRPELAKALNLRPDQRITLAQSVGYPKQ
jgi:nitroreductase